MKRKNSRYLIVLFLLIFVSIGYALIASSLSVTGIGEFKKNKWDVHFENVDILEGKSLASVAPKTIARTTTELNYTVDFNIPGDVYKFNVDIVNLGTIDAMVSLIGNIELTENQKRFAEYTITYEDGSPLEDKNFLASNSRDTITVTIKYKKDLSEEDLAIVETIDFNLNLEYSLAKEADTRENTSMIVKDLSGNGNDGIIYGGKYNSDGTFTTDGVNDYIDSGLEDYDFGENISIVTRVKAESNDQGYIITNHEAAGFGLTINHKCFCASFFINGNYRISCSSAFDSSKWYTVVATYNGNKLILYVNGVEVSKVENLTGPVAASPVPVVIGANPYFDDIMQAFTGFTLSDMLIFKRALTSEEIGTDYSGTVNPVNKDNLLLYYEFK